MLEGVFLSFAVDGFTSELNFIDLRAATDGGIRHMGELTRREALVFVARAVQW